MDGWIDEWIDVPALQIGDASRSNQNDFIFPSLKVKDDKYQEYRPAAKDSLIGLTFQINI